MTWLDGDVTFEPVITTTPRRQQCHCSWMSTTSKVVSQSAM